jgi:ribonuclease HI
LTDADRAKFGKAGSRTEEQKTLAMEFYHALLKSFKPKAVLCFTDGSCQSNPGPCGAGVAVQLNGGFLEKSVALGRRGTNNIGELYAVGLAMDLVAAEQANGLIKLGCPVEILTDSRYAEGVLAKDWHPTTNLGLINMVKEKLANVRRRNPVTLHWVPGHNGIEGNERADRLADEGAKRSAEGKGMLRTPAALPLVHQGSRSQLRTSRNSPAPLHLTYSVVALISQWKRRRKGRTSTVVGWTCAQTKT